MKVSTCLRIVPLSYNLTVCNRVSSRFCGNESSSVAGVIVPSRGVIVPSRGEIVQVVPPHLLRSCRRSRPWTPSAWPPCWSPPRRWGSGSWSRGRARHHRLPSSPCPNSTIIIAIIIFTTCMFFLGNGN